MIRQAIYVMALLGSSAAWHSSSAAPTSKPLPGYGCMMLNQTEQQSMDPNVHVNILEGPSPSARSVGWAGSIVAVKQPTAVQNGYVEVMMPNGRTGWIPATSVRQYHSAADPSAHCRPVILPSGMVGFGPG